MSYEKSTGYHDHDGNFAPPSEPPPSYNSSSTPYQPSYPAPREPIPYPSQQPSTGRPRAPQGPSYLAPQAPPYPAPQGPPYPTQRSQPAPSSSTRAPLPPRNFAPFKTITVPTLRYRLADGFSPDLPPSHEQPHPFASHDVTQEDWLAFLGDIRRITQNTSEERMRETFGAESSSFVSGLGSGGRGGGLARGLIGAIAEGVTKSMNGGATKAAQEPISLLIADWNRNFWNHRNIEVSLALKDAPADPYASTQSRSQAQGRGLGLCSQSRRGRRDDGGRRAEKRAQRSAFGTELIADVSQMFGAKESSAAFRAAADEERYGDKPGWCLVLRYTGPANYASGGGTANGWATRP